MEKTEMILMNFFYVIIAPIILQLLAKLLFIFGTVGKIW